MKVIVSGASGQLGQCLKDQVNHFPNYSFQFFDRIGLDITDSEAVEKIIKDEKASFFINCAAYTAVDKAEEEKEIAYQINGQAVNGLGRICKENNVRLIHISTDYVFNGTSSIPYEVNAPKDPQSVYGASKSEGEDALKDTNSIIIRTSWVYSEYGKNFLKTMIRLGGDRDELNVVSDQVGCPTYAGDLAYAILQVMDRADNKELKVLHYCNSGETNWCGFAQTIMEIAELDCKVNPIPTSDYPTPAKRPSYSLLSLNDITRDYGISIPYWKDSVEKCIKKLKASENDN